MKPKIIAMENIPNAPTIDGKECPHCIVFISYTPSIKPNLAWIQRRA
jgi:hypothetical protein